MSLGRDRADRVRINGELARNRFPFVSPAAQHLGTPIDRYRDHESGRWGVYTQETGGTRQSIHLSTQKASPRAGGHNQVARREVRPRLLARRLPILRRARHPQLLEYDLRIVADAQESSSSGGAAHAQLRSIARMP
jgi:hypothetical protein